ncbi:hypothetical protein ABPG72_005745 [Tetrahymena utriculariae]
MLEVLGPIFGLLGLYKYKSYSLNMIFQEKIMFSKDTAVVGKLYQKKIAVLGDEMQKSQLLFKGFLQKNGINYKNQVRQKKARKSLSQQQQQDILKLKFNLEITIQQSDNSQIYLGQRKQTLQNQLEASQQSKQIQQKIQQQLKNQLKQQENRENNYYQNHKLKQITCQKMVMQISQRQLNQLKNLIRALDQKENLTLIRISRQTLRILNQECLNLSQLSLLDTFQSQIKAHQKSITIQNFMTKIALFTLKMIGTNTWQIQLSQIKRILLDSLSLSQNANQMRFRQIRYYKILTYSTQLIQYYSKQNIILIII